MRKTALAAALALAMALPGTATAGGYGPGQQGTLHLAGVKLHFHFGHDHHRFFGHPKHEFRGKHRHFRKHRPHHRGHQRFVVPHAPPFHDGFVGRPHHRPKHFEHGFVPPKVWYYKPGHHGHFKPWHFKRHGHGHFKHRGFKHRRHGHFKHRFKHRHRRHW